jgi:hypothetical protein
MFEQVRSAIEHLEVAVRDLDLPALGPSDARTLVELYSRAQHVCGAGIALAARHVEDTGAWVSSGAPDAAAWLASVAGTTAGEAATVLETARHLDDLPATDAAFRAGDLSLVQAASVTSAAHVAPAAEADLLRVAAEDSVKGLRNHERRVKAAAMTAEEEERRLRSIRRTRYHRSWHDELGAYCYQGRTTPEAGAVINAAIETYEREVFKAARERGDHDLSGAYRADAMVALAQVALGADPGLPRPTRPATVLVRLDATALRNGTTGAGEVCEIAGIGPVPVATAREFLGDALLKIVITEGTDVRGVVHAGRTINAKLRTALQWLYAECAVVGCNRTQHLHMHHVTPFAVSGITAIDELVGICEYDHDLVHHRGFSLRRRADGRVERIPP